MKDMNGKSTKMVLLGIVQLTLMINGVKGKIDNSGFTARDRMSKVFEKKCKSCGTKIRHKPLIERGVKGTLGSITGFFTGAFVGTLMAPGPGTLIGALTGAAEGASTGDKTPDYCRGCCGTCNKKLKNCTCESVYAYIDDDDHSYYDDGY